MDYESPPQNQSVHLYMYIPTILNERINLALRSVDLGVQKEDWVVAALEAAVDRCLHQEKELKDIPAIPTTEKYQMDFRRTFNPDYKPKDQDETPAIPATENNLMDLHRRMTKLEHAVDRLTDQCSSIEARAKASRTNTFNLANEVLKIAENATVAKIAEKNDLVAYAGDLAGTTSTVSICGWSCYKLEPDKFQTLQQFIDRFSMTAHQAEELFNVVNEHLVLSHDRKIAAIAISAGAPTPLGAA